MARNLLYGDSVLDLVRRLHAVDGTVLIIRHSERPPFDDIPIGEWDRVGLTDRGVKAARGLGRALAQDGEVLTLSAFGWGLKRCLDTADLVAIGAGEVGCRSSSHGIIGFTSPIADRRKYDVALGSGHWEEFVDGWLSEKSQDGALVPAREYAARFFRELSERHLLQAEGVSLIVTHDLQIYPLVGFLLGIPIRKLDFLDGLVIKESSEDLQVGFGVTVRSVRLSELFS